MAAHKRASEDPSLRYTSMLLRRSATSKQQQRPLAEGKGQCKYLVFTVKDLEADHVYMSGMAGPETTVLREEMG